MNKYRFEIALTVGVIVALVCAIAAMSVAITRPETAIGTTPTHIRFPTGYHHYTTGWFHLDHTVTAGETLWGIARRAYGDPRQWPSIAADNNITTPHLIRPGQHVWLKTAKTMDL